MGLTLVLLQIISVLINFGTTSPSTTNASDMLPLLFALSLAFTQPRNSVSHHTSWRTQRSSPLPRQHIVQVHSSMAFLDYWPLHPGKLSSRNFLPLSYPAHIGHGSWDQSFCNNHGLPNTIPYVLSFDQVLGISCAACYSRPLITPLWYLLSMFPGTPAPSLVL